MLYFAFHSVGESLLIFTAIPLSAIGGVLAIWLRGMPFSISAGVGFIALFGIAVLNGIVLLTEFNQLKNSGMTNIKDRILQGTRTRLRPVLMTASVASMGFLPMALSTGAGAEVQRPLATVVIGGLITATLLTLLVLPVLYMSFESKTKRQKNNGHNKALLLLLVLIGSSFGTLSAQEKTISLPEAITIGLQQNRSLQSAKLHTQSLQRLEKSAWDIPFTSIEAEYGQLNSIQNDTRFMVAQSMAFPIVYKRQQQLFALQTESSRLHEQITQQQMKKRLTQLYYQMLLMGEQRNLLLQADSLYAGFLQKQEQRFKAGDINIVEKTAAETQRMQVQNQLQQLAADFKIVQTQFSYLLNSPTLYIPQPASLKIAVSDLPDTVNIEQYPALQWKQQQQQIALQEIKVARAKNLPQLMAGYNNQSIIGYQNINGIDKYFDGGKRFSSVMAGIAIPLFNTAGKARVAAGQIRYEAIQSEYEDTLALQKSIVQQLLLSHQKNSQAIYYYENSALKQADILSENATLQFTNGAINFLEWAMLVNQAISIRSEYIKAVDQWNQTIIELQTYTSSLQNK